jgi:hypothetical protein
MVVETVVEIAVDFAIRNNKSKNKMNYNKKALIPIFIAIFGIVFALFFIFKVKSDKVAQIQPENTQKVKLADSFKDLPTAQQAIKSQLLTDKPDFDNALVLARKQVEELKANPDASPKGIENEARVQQLLGSILLDNGKWNKNEENLIEGIDVLKKVVLNEKYPAKYRSRALVVFADIFYNGSNDELVKKYLFTGDKFQDFIKTPAYNPVYGGLREMLVWASKLSSDPIADLRVADLATDELLFNEELTKEERMILEGEYAGAISRGKMGADWINKSVVPASVDAKNPQHRNAYAYDLLARVEGKSAMYYGKLNPENIAVIDGYFAKSREFANAVQPKIFETRWIETVDRFYEAQWYFETGRKEKAAQFYAYILNPSNSDMFKRFSQTYVVGKNQGNYIQYYRRGLLFMANDNADFKTAFANETGWSDIQNITIPSMHTTGK